MGSSERTCSYNRRSLRTSSADSSSGDKSVKARQTLAGCCEVFANALADGVGLTSCQALIQVTHALGIVVSMCKLIVMVKWIRMVHAKLLFPRSRSSKPSKPTIAKRKVSSLISCVLASCLGQQRISDVLGRVVEMRTWWRLAAHADLTL